MSSKSIRPQNLPEKIVWYYIIGTYIIFLLGAHYVLTPLMGCVLLFYLGKKWWYQTETTLETERIIIAPLAWAWLLAILVIELALIVGHFNFDLGIAQIIKSSSHWYRTWAIFAIFPIAGYLEVRPPIIYRAICILCLQSIIVAAIGTLLSLVITPPVFYVSPLQVTGGDILQYQVDLIHTVINDRLRLFAPWATGLGMTGNIYFLFSWQETDKKWRIIGLLGSLMMIICSWSRLAIVTLFFVPTATWILSNFIRPWMQLTTSIICFFSGLFFVNLVDFLNFLETKVNSLRTDTGSSSRTREAIYKLTLYLWRNQAPIWGHGLTGEEGPAAIDYFPIASHQTWYYLLYTHGIVGFIPLFIATVWTFINLLIKSQNERQAKLGLSIFLVILFSSFIDNIQTYAYLYWPALLMLGITLKQKSSLSYSKSKMITKIQY